ncbi:peptidase M48, partial [Microcoleus sp. POL10_C6]
AQLSHPVPVLRAREIDRWASSKDYEYLLAGNRSVWYDGETKKGGWRNW